MSGVREDGDGVCRRDLPFGRRAYRQAASPLPLSLLRRSVLRRCRNAPDSADACLISRGRPVARPMPDLKASTAGIGRRLFDHLHLLERQKPGQRVRTTGHCAFQPRLSERVLGRGKEHKRACGFSTRALRCWPHREHRNRGLGNSRLLTAPSGPAMLACSEESVIADVFLLEMGVTS